MPLATFRYLSPSGRCRGLLSSPVQRVLSPATPLNLHTTSPLRSQRAGLQLSADQTMHPAAPTTTAVASAEQPFDPHFLIVSLGNPPPYADSLHSAGHIALQSLQSLLQRDAGQPRFSSERLGKKATQASRGPRYTLLQCPTLMNVSGSWLARAWRETLQQHEENHPGTPLGLVVVHDDLEEDTCVVRVRRWDRSHRGHNGLKSIMSLMASPDPSHHTTRWAKISLGIGRPEGRDHATVSDYVLRPLSKYQRDSFFEKSGPPVLAALQEIEATWRSEREKGASDDVRQPTSSPGKKGRGKGQKGRAS